MGQALPAKLLENPRVNIPSVFQKDNFGTYFGPFVKNLLLFNCVLFIIIGNYLANYLP